MKNKIFMSIFCLLLAFLFLFNISSTTVYASNISNNIIVYGESSRQITPDTATINASIQSLNEDVFTAKNATLYLYEKAKNQLVKNNINIDNINILHFNTYPSFDKNDNNTIVGYYANLSFEFTLNNLQDINNYIDILLTNGIKNVNSICFSVKNYSKIYNELLNEAISNAKQKAYAILDTDIINIKLIEELETYNSHCVYRNYLLTENNDSFNNKISISAKVKLELE